MPKRSHRHDEYDDFDEPWDDDATSDDEPVDTVPCPECHEEVYEESAHCPHCGHYLSVDTNPWSGRPAWWIVLGLLGMLALAAALISFF
jgi:hypothetical protein